MPLHFVPWLVGAFMLTPFLLWLVLGLLVFPGAWNGFDKVVGTSALLATIPLVAWFFVRGLATFANSMAGGHPDGRLRHRVPRAIVAALPAATLLLGAAGAAKVALLGEPLWAGAVPLAVAGLVAGAIVAGERAAQRVA
jgi:hypothetical protein